MSVCLSKHCEVGGVLTDHSGALKGSRVRNLLKIRAVFRTTDCLLYSALDPTAAKLLHKAFIHYLFSNVSVGIDQSLSGNYTCLAKNLYGSDSVVYSVKVLPLPDPPSLRATPYKDSIVVEWDEIRTANDMLGYGIGKYLLTWFSYYLHIMKS